MGKQQNGIYCEYCKLKLLHKSLYARRQHEHGKKHIQNKIDYWQKVVREQNLKAPDFTTLK